MMYADIAANLDEVMQVRGCPLNEDELWAILRKLITILHEATGVYEQNCNTRINVVAHNHNMLRKKYSTSDF